MALLKSKVTSKEIVEALAQRHAEDVFIPECKNGPTQSGSHLRLDAWAMKKSWSNPLVTGYEIKCSRSDFIKDDKWHNYLAYCNSLYFVCPGGLIQPSELQPEVGLMWMSETGSRLYIKRKAPWRDVVVPENLYRYILMCRVATKSESQVFASKGHRLANWREWLAERAEGKSLGFRVSQAVARHVYEVERENERLKKENEAFGVFRARLEELGVNPGHGVTTWTIESALNRLRGKIEPWVPVTLDQAESALKSIRELLASNGNHD